MNIATVVYRLRESLLRIEEHLRAARLDRQLGKFSNGEHVLTIQSSHAPHGEILFSLF